MWFFKIIFPQPRMEASQYFRSLSDGEGSKEFSVWISLHWCLSWVFSQDRPTLFTLQIHLLTYLLTYFFLDSILPCLVLVEFPWCSPSYIVSSTTCPSHVQVRHGKEKKVEPEVCRDGVDICKVTTLYPLCTMTFLGGLGSGVGLAIKQSWVRFPVRLL